MNVHGAGGGLFEVLGDVIGTIKCKTTKTDEEDKLYKSSRYKMMDQ